MKRRLLERSLAQANGGASGHDSGRELPLSFAQRRLWLLEQMDPDTAAYNTGEAWRIVGDLDADSLRSALDGVVARHEALRTTVGESSDGEPLQIVHPPEPVTLAEVDLSGEADPVVALERLFRSEADRPFDLSAERPLRATLVRAGPDEHVLLLIVHHIASDGASKGVLMRELGEFYRARRGGRPADLAPVDAHYGDFAERQRSWFGGTEADDQLAYWRENLAGAPPSLDLPTDKARPLRRGGRGGRHLAHLDGSMTSALHQLARTERTTLFAVLLSTYAGLLGRYAGADDLVVGIPASGRSSDFENVIGNFSNTLPIRADVAGEPTARTLIHRVREALVGALSHADVPFERLVEELRSPRDGSRTPIFQTMFALQDPSAARAELHELHVEPLRLDPGWSRFDLSLTALEERDGLTLQWEYSTELFEPATIATLADHFTVLLRAVIGDPDTRVLDVPLLAPAEIDGVLALGRGAPPDPSPGLVHALIADRAVRAPGAIAVEAPDGQLTYAELDRRASRVAAGLAGHGVGRGTLVGICCERSFDMVVAILGVLRAGAAYLPLDPSYPRDRLAFMVGDAAPALVLAQDAVRDRVPDNATVVTIAALQDDRAAVADAAPAAVVSADDLAYVLYTSGSTGTPKGVMIEHGALSSFVAAMRSEPGLDASDVLLAVTTLSFDIAVLELLLPLTLGARVVIASREDATDGTRLLDLARECGATTMQATPATWRLLIEAGWDGDPALRALCGGEELTADLAAALVDRSPEVWNLYGPTEATVWCAIHRVHAGDRPVPIGRPIAGMETYVVAPDLSVQPIGVAGELVVGGAGLARGYLNRPEATSAAFVSCPFDTAGPGRIYRTGDRARLRADGTLQFLGRLDNQLKVRGFRVEPGEIEAAIADAGVAASAVVAHDDGEGDARLVAYIVPAADDAFDLAALKVHLRRRLPSYMVPSAFVSLPSLPLSPAGKVDRRALPDPGADQVRSAPWEPPQSAVECTVAEQFADVLGVDRVGLHDDFFELGGHSLLALRVVGQLREVFGGGLTLRQLFDGPTVADTAAHVGDSLVADADADELAELLDELAEAGAHDA